VLEGSPVSFGVEVSGCPPIRYQWYWNQTNLVEGATNAVLQFSEVQAEQAGEYTMRASNRYGIVNSAGSELVVLVPARIVGGPENLVVVEGQSAQFRVEVRGTEPVFY
jgi:hypothetical protein